MLQARPEIRSDGLQATRKHLSKEGGTTANHKRQLFH
jgi:hypothetical protein